MWIQSLFFLSANRVWSKHNIQATVFLASAYASICSVSHFVRVTVATPVFWWNFKGYITKCPWIHIRPTSRGLIQTGLDFRGGWRDKARCSQGTLSSRTLWYPCVHFAPWFSPVPRADGLQRVLEGGGGKMPATIRPPQALGSSTLWIGWNLVPSPTSLSPPPQV